MKLATTGYDWVIVDGYPDQAFWKSFIESKDRTLFGNLKKKESK